MSTALLPLRNDHVMVAIGTSRTWPTVPAVVRCLTWRAPSFVAMTC